MKCLDIQTLSERFQGLNDRCQKMTSGQFQSRNRDRFDGSNSSFSSDKVNKDTLIGTDDPEINHGRQSNAGRISKANQFGRVDISVYDIARDFQRLKTGELLNKGTPLG
uniref:Uncharacterized protein n=1 Tax=Cacopsylla melanoneura TaxID=428564 RepID=A0A8D8XS44_9HEMI